MIPPAPRVGRGGETRESIVPPPSSPPPKRPPPKRKSVFKIPKQFLEDAPIEPPDTLPPPIKEDEEIGPPLSSPPAKVCQWTEEWHEELQMCYFLNIDDKTSQWNMLDDFWRKPTSDDSDEDDVKPHASEEEYDEEIKETLDWLRSD